MSFLNKMFGRKRTFGEKMGRLAVGKNPFTRKITLGSVIYKPYERLGQAIVLGAADGAVMGLVSLTLTGAAKGAKKVFHYATSTEEKPISTSLSEESKKTVTEVAEMITNWEKPKKEASKKTA